MTSHPSPDGISDERHAEIHAMAQQLVDIRVAKKALVDAEEWERAADRREEERAAQRVVVEWLNDSPAEFLALCTLVRGASEDRAAKVTRFEVIDHRGGAEARGREFTAFDCCVSLSYQDDGRTLKAFVDDADRTSQDGSPT